MNEKVIIITDENPPIVVGTGCGVGTGSGIGTGMGDKTTGV